MTIIALQRRLRELGRIRMGTRGDKGQPVKLSTWRLTSPSESLLEVAADLYGGDVSPWTSPAGAQFQLTTATDTLDAIVPPGQTFSQWFEQWSGGGCQRRCDGEYEQISDGPCLCPQDDDERRTLAAKGQACRITTRLGLILPRLPDVGLWRLDTGGFYAATELAGAFDITAMATTQGRMVAVKLRLEQRMTKKGGGTLRYAVPVLELNVTMGELVKSFGAGAIVGAALPPGDGELVDDVEAERAEKGPDSEGSDQSTGAASADPQDAGTAPSSAPAPGTNARARSGSKGKAAPTDADAPADHKYVGDGEGLCTVPDCPHGYIEGHPGQGRLA